MLDLTRARRRRSAARLDGASGPLDALRRLSRLARQAGRTRRAGRRGLRHRSLLARRDPPIPRAIRSRLQRPSRSAGLRAFFNDSYEVDDATGQADGTPAFLRWRFATRRGYDLRDALAGARSARTGGDATTRVLADYRVTISDLLLETFTTEWNDVGASARRRDTQPGPWVAGESARPVRGQRHSRNRGHRDRAQQVGGVGGHVAGRRLVAGRSGDLARRTLPLDAGRHSRERSIATSSRGVNHIVYHGTAASPASAAVAGLAVLCVGRVQRSQSVVARSAGAESVRDARAVVPAVRRAGPRCAAVLPVLRLRRQSAAPARLAHFGGADVPD